jgi:hypothetical protein
VEGAVKPRLVLVSGPWGSGSTAVTGALVHAGLIGFGPYFQTNDPRTPNSYEWLPFRACIQRFVSESTLALTTPSVETVRSALQSLCDDILVQRHGAYDPRCDPPLVMKYALSALLLPVIAEVFDLRLVVVTRPLPAIEATARRRGWGPQFGAAGAELVYAHLFGALVALGTPTELLHYPRLLTEPEAALDRILGHCGQCATPVGLAAAVAFVRGPG